MLTILVIKDTNFENELFNKLPFEKVFVENSPEEISKTAKNYKKVVITWNSTTLLDVSLIENLFKQNSEISFIANLPEYMEFEVWDSEFLVNTLEKYRKTAKPLRNILPPIELDESVYYTDIHKKDIRLYRFELSPFSHKGRELSKKVLNKIDTSKNVLEQIETILKDNPEYLVEIPTFYYLEISSKRIETTYIPSWENEIKDVEIDNFKEILNKVTEYSKTCGVMIGVFNEPLYHPEIDKILKIIEEYKSKQVSFIINTSLPILPKELVKLFEETKGIEGFKGYPFLSIFVDLPSNKKETYEKLKKLDIQTVMKNLNEIVSIDTERVFIKFVRNKYNEDELIEFYNNLKQYQIIIQRPQEREIISVETILPTRIPCYKLQSSLLILSNGDTYLCINDTKMKHKLGNVISEEINKVCLNKTKKLKEHFNHEFTDICQNCTIWDQFDL